MIDVIKPVFRSLAHPDFLRKCLHGKTQNTNESFNNIIWCRVPKTVFVGANTLSIGVHDAVLTFNEGSSGRIKVLKRLGIEPGMNMVKACQNIDYLRVKKADIHNELKFRNARKVRRGLKRPQRRKMTLMTQNMYLKHIKGMVKFECHFLIIVTLCVNVHFSLKLLRVEP